MAKVSESPDGILLFRCPGCGDYHSVCVEGPGWTWNRSVDSPTLSPSILVRSGHYLPGHRPGDSCWCTYNAEHPEHIGKSFICVICHSFVTDGKIQFLPDCTHALAGHTVDLPEWEREMHSS